MKIRKLLASTIIGDVIGSYYEGAQPVELMTDPLKLLSESELLRILPLDAEKHRKTWVYTDDTVCSLALLQAFLNNAAIDENLRKYCQLYSHPLVGFGGTFKKWLSDPNMGPYGSNANGCLMRIGFIPSLPLDEAKSISLALDFTNITHNSTEAQQCVIDFIELCFSLKTTRSKESLRKYLKKQSFEHTVKSLRDRKLFSMGCLETLGIAIVCVLFSSNFEEVLLNCLNVGGDTDTIAVVALNIAQQIYPVNTDFFNFSMAVIQKQSNELFNEINS